MIQLAHSLCAGLEDPPRARGRPRTPLSDVLVGALLWVYGTKASRHAMFDFEACLEKGLLSTRLHYNTMHRYMKDSALTPILRMLLLESARPFQSIETQFAIDSTGFSTNQWERWMDHKWHKNRGDDLCAAA